MFIGPADMAADMGYLGKPAAQEVQEAVQDGLRKIVAAGMPAGILMAIPELVEKYLEIGATFVAVGTDVTTFASSTDALANKWIGKQTESTEKGVY